MELRGLWRVVARRWWLIVIPAVMALTYAVYGYASSPLAINYTTQVRLTASLPPGEETISYEDTALAPWTSSEYVVNGLVDWVRTSSFADEVSGRLEQETDGIPPQIIQGAISADNERSVMSLYITMADPVALEAVAEAAIAVLKEKSEDYLPQLEDGGVEVVALDKPIITPVPPPLTTRLEPLIRFALGLVAGIGLAFLIEYLDPSIHDRLDAERTGLEILAEIPVKRSR